MVCEWGMSQELGPIALGQKDEPIFIGKEIARHKDYSEETAQTIDREVRGFVQGGLEKAMRLLKDNREELDTLADALVERETLDDSDVRELLGFPERVEPEEEDKKD
jgi:cell division protease FtsH